MKEENIPKKKVNVAEVFGIDTKLEVLAFESPTERVPELETSYVVTRRQSTIYCAFRRGTRSACPRWSARYFIYREGVVFAVLLGRGSGIYLQMVRLVLSAARRHLPKGISQVAGCGGSAPPHKSLSPCWTFCPCVACVHYHGDGIKGDGKFDEIDAIVCATFQLLAGDGARCVGQGNVAAAECTKSRR